MTYVYRIDQQTYFHLRSWAEREYGRSDDLEGQRVDGAVDRIMAYLDHAESPEHAEQMLGWGWPALDRYATA